MSSTGLSAPIERKGCVVFLHKAMFPNEGEKPDHEWIPLVAAKGLAIITSDKNQKSWHAEGGRVRAAIEQSHAKVFFLRGSDLTPAEQAKAVVAARHRIRRCVNKCAGTYVMARIHSRGDRLGELQLLYQGGSTKADRKYGTKAMQSDDVDLA